MLNFNLHNVWEENLVFLFEKNLLSLTLEGGKEEGSYQIPFHLPVSDHSFPWAYDNECHNYDDDKNHTNDNANNNASSHRR